MLTNCSPTDPTSQWATCYTYLHFSRYTKQQGLDALPYEAPNVKGLHKSKIKRAGEGLVIKKDFDVHGCGKIVSINKDDPAKSLYNIK